MKFLAQYIRLLPPKLAISRVLCYRLEWSFYSRRRRRKRADFQAHRMFFLVILFDFDARCRLSVREKSFRHTLTENRYHRLEYNDNDKESFKYGAKQNKTKQNKAKRMRTAYMYTLLYEMRLDAISVPKLSYLFNHQRSSQQKSNSVFLSLFYLCFSRVLENSSSCAASFEIRHSPTGSFFLSLHFIYSI